MQRIKPIQVVIRLLFLFITLLMSQACQSTEIPQETNDILQALVKSGSNNTILNITMADSLMKEFQVPITMEQLKEPPFFSDYRPHIESIITDSDIDSWNDKIEQYRAGIFDFEHVENIPAYVPKNRRILNSDLKLSEFESFATVSIPFMNSLEDKTIFYVEYFSSPEAQGSKNSFIIIMKKEDGSWKEIYRKLLVVTSS